MISVTMLSGYMWCPRQLYIERVLKIRGPPSPALAHGCVRHSALENTNAYEERIVKSVRESDSQEDIAQRYICDYAKALKQAVLKNKSLLQKLNMGLPAAFRHAKQSIIDIANSRARRLYSFVIEHNVFGDELWLKLTPKIKTEYRIESEKLGLKGIIDRLEVYDDRLVPIELKTGKTPKQGIWPGHRIQIAAYIMLLQQEKSNQSSSGFVEYLDEKQKREVILNDFMKNEVFELKEKVEKLLSSHVIPGACNNNSCLFCKIKELPENHNLLRAKLEALFQQAKRT